jgi:hypothetical protein
MTTGGSDGVTRGSMPRPVGVLARWPGAEGPGLGPSVI